MAADIDIRAVSAFTSLSEGNINSLLDAPTTDAIVSLLAAVESKAKEYENSKAQKVRLEVELETVVRTSESKAKVLQNSRDKALADASKLRGDLQASENVKSRLESEIEQAKSSTSDEASEISILKSRVSSLESGNRDTLALLDSKTTSYDKLAQDFSAERLKNSELRKQVTTAEQNAQTATSTLASSKFRQQSLQQEVDSLKKTNEWLESERNIKAEEHATFRKEKNGRIAELSRLNEQYIAETQSLQRTESTLNTRVKDLNDRLEESIDDMQKLRDEKLSEADGFRAEIESVNRLAELQKASADTAKQRVQELSAALDEIRDEATDEIGRIRAEVESVHADREAAEQRVAELETRIQQLEADIDEARARPATPVRGINGSTLTTPARPGTPVGIFSPSTSSRLKGQLSTTQLYSEYKKLEKELAAEKKNNEQLQTDLNAMLEDLETSRPAIEELRADYSNLQSTLLATSSMMESANADREAAIKEARMYQGQVAGKDQELEVIGQQLKDLSTQIRYLLIEQYMRERGDTFTRDEFADLQRQADQALQKDVENLSETQQVVNQQLIAFRSVAELQALNESQLKTIRNLVSTLESNEAKEREADQLNLQQELETARKQITSYQDEIKSMVAQSKSFVKERDMFRNMLTRRGHLPAHIDATDFSRSLPIPAGSPAPVAADTLSISGDSDYAKLLKDLQQHFDSFRQEASTDRSTLKAQVDDLTKRSTQLQTEVSRSLGQLTAANQRAEMLQSNYNMLKNENAEVQKRSYAAMENSTKQEMKIQQVAEELVEARGLLDSTRRESANLKAEKDLWKSIESRLIDDNESLRKERSRLDQLNGSLQSILNEREQTDSETRRRLQTQIEGLESEIQVTKRKLNDEIEESRKASLRKEYEHEQSQKRIDDLVTSLSSTREELAAATTSRDHLQARVDELTVELRSAEERMEVLTRPAQQPENTSGSNEDTTLSQEQQLAVQVSELRRDLELQQTELERANEQVEVYKGISQASEERLQELTETNDQYRAETDATIAEKEAKIKDLEQRIEDISAELNTTNNELSTLRDQESQSMQKLEEQRASLTAEIDRLKEQDEKHAEQAQFNQEASKAQAQIATEAQQNYENELLKHAEAARNLHAVRTEANQLRLGMVDLRTAAETAKTDLEQKEESWNDLRERYERELADLKKRREEVLQQNNILHGQLDNVAQQISALQRDRAAIADNDTADGHSSGIDGLQEVINYLRREKEIVDVQYHLSVQESKRLRQQLDFTQSQLDDTRLKLDQQRRAEADSERNAMSHNKLMEVLNELNLHRESSVTLRAEAKQATQALTERNSRIEELEAQIQPLQARIAELENSAELRDGQMKLLQDDRDHWQQRTQNILSKYDRVDPAELESMKEKLTDLEAERDAAVASQTTLQAQIDAIPEQVEAARQELRARLQEQFRAKVREQNTKIREKQTEVDSALAEKAGLETELDNLKQELEEARARLAELEARPITETAVTSNVADTEDSTNPKIADLELTISDLQSAVAQKEKELENIKLEHDDKFKSRETEMRNVLNKRLAEVKKEAETAKAAALDELRETLILQHQQDVEALRSQSVPVDQNVQNAAVNGEAAQTVNSTNGGATQPTELTDEMLENITEAQARALAQKNETLRNILRVNIRKGVEKEKEALRKELTEAQGATGDDAAAAEQIERLEQQFAAEKESLIQEKEAEFSSEKEALIKQHEEGLARERQDLVIKHQEDMASQKLEFSQESERKIAEQVANAEKLAEKRMTVKLNMATNQARLANAKLDVVKKAVDETPEMAVSEVWSTAKDAKPSPLQPALKPASIPTASAPAASTVPAPAGPVQQIPTEASKPTTTPSEATSTDAADPETKAEENADGQVNAAGRAAPNNVGTGPAALRQLTSGLPRGGSFRGRGGIAQPSQTHNANAAQQPQTQQQQAQQQPAGRGSGIPRGGAGRGNRGGGRSVSGLQTNIPATGAGRGGPASAAGSPGRANLNPQAQQFTPGGNKRAREDGSESGEAGNQGKRIRGGGVGAGT